MFCFYAVTENCIECICIIFKCFFLYFFRPSDLNLPRPKRRRIISPAPDEHIDLTGGGQTQNTTKKKRVTKPKQSDLSQETTVENADTLSANQQVEEDTSLPKNVEEKEDKNVDKKKKKPVTKPKQSDLSQETTEDNADTLSGNQQVEEATSLPKNIEENEDKKGGKKKKKKNKKKKTKKNRKERKDKKEKGGDNEDNKNKKSSKKDKKTTYKKKNDEGQKENNGDHKVEEAKRNTEDVQLIENTNKEKEPEEPTQNNGDGNREDGKKRTADDQLIEENAKEKESEEPTQNNGDGNREEAKRNTEDVQLIENTNKEKEPEEPTQNNGDGNREDGKKRTADDQLIEGNAQEKEPEEPTQNNGDGNREDGKKHTADDQLIEENAKDRKKEEPKENNDKEEKTINNCDYEDDDDYADNFYNDDEYYNNDDDYDDADNDNNIIAITAPNETESTVVDEAITNETQTDDVSEQELTSEKMEGYETVTPQNAQEIPAANIHEGQIFSSEHMSEIPITKSAIADVKTERKSQEGRRTLKKKKTSPRQIMRVPPKRKVDVKEELRDGKETETEDGKEAETEDGNNGSSHENNKVMEPDDIPLSEIKYQMKYGLKQVSVSLPRLTDEDITGVQSTKAPRIQPNIKPQKSPSEMLDDRLEKLTKTKTVRISDRVVDKDMRALASRGGHSGIYEDDVEETEENVDSTGIGALGPRADIDKQGLINVLERIRNDKYSCGECKLDFENVHSFENHLVKAEHEMYKSDTTDLEEEKQGVVFTIKAIVDSGSESNSPDKLIRSVKENKIWIKQEVDETDETKEDNGEEKVEQEIETGYGKDENASEELEVKMIGIKQEIDETDETKEDNGEEKVEHESETGDGKEENASKELKEKLIEHTQEMSETDETKEDGGEDKLKDAHKEDENRKEGKKVEEIQDKRDSDGKLENASEEVKKKMIEFEDETDKPKENNGNRKEGKKVEEDLGACEKKKNADEIQEKGDCDGKLVESSLEETSCESQAPSSYKESSSSERIKRDAFFVHATFCTNIPPSPERTEETTTEYKEISDSSDGKAVKRKADDIECVKSSDGKAVKRKADDIRTPVESGYETGSSIQRKKRRKSRKIARCSDTGTDGTINVKSEQMSSKDEIEASANDQNQDLIKSPCTKKKVTRADRQKINKEMLKKKFDPYRKIRSRYLKRVDKAYRQRIISPERLTDSDPPPIPVYTTETLESDPSPPRPGLFEAAYATEMRHPGNEKECQSQEVTDTTISGSYI